MEIAQVDLTIKNALLSRLQSKTLVKAYTTVPDRALPAALRAQLDFIKLALGLAATSDETNTFVMQGKKTEAGYIFKRLFQPKVYKQTAEDGKQTLVLRWGNEHCPIHTAKSSLSIPASEGFAGVNKDTENCSLAISSTGSDAFLDVCVKAVVETPAGYIYAEFPVATNTDVKGVDLKTAMDLNITKALDLVKELPEEIEETETVDLLDLTPGTYQITGYHTFTTEHGPSVILRASAAPELGQEKPFSFFSRDYAATFLSNPVISAESPAVLTMISVTPKTGKQKKDRPNYTITLPTQVEDGSYVSLDF